MSRRKSKKEHAAPAAPAGVVPEAMPASAPVEAPPAPLETPLRPAPWLVAVLLALVTLGLYAPAAGFDFISYDDPLFIINNPHLPGGFTRDNLVWAFTNHDAFLWHPLTWLSHLLDYALYGLAPGGHHFTSVALHAGSTAILFLLLLRMTGALWRSAMVAALFAWHPLHVESVAWVAERKDVLSGFFWMLTLGSYARYVERPGGWRYAQMAGLFVLGLLSKPMVVTLPCVLLLLDVWPLKRLPLEFPEGRWWPQIQWRAAGKLVVEKILLLALGLVISIVTVWVMNRMGGLASVETVSLGRRLANSLVGYATYFGDMFWPVNLAVFYPFPAAFPLWQVAGAGLLLLGITAMVVRGMRHSPWLLTGWLWFLGTLLPVIGLLQNGYQSMADRYTYIPYVGLFVALVWGVVALAEKYPHGQRALPKLAVTALVSCALVTTVQLQHWRNTSTLFGHALEVTRDNALAHNLVGGALETQGHTDEAIAHYREAIRIDPRYIIARENLGHALVFQGRTSEATETYRETLKIFPGAYRSHHNLAGVLYLQGKFPEAIASYREALRHAPDSVVSQVGLAGALAATGKFAEANAAYREALRHQPDSVEALVGLGTALVNQGKSDEAITHFQAALRRQPRSPEAHAGWGLALMRQNKLAEAELELRESMRLKDSAMIHNDLANVLLQEKKATEAITHYRAALQINPNWDLPLSGLAWLLAVHSDPKLRDGPTAVKLAQRACAVTGQRDAFCLNTLAAAYAETGQFPEAIATAQKALQLAAATGQAALGQSIAGCLRFYQRGQAYHEPP